MEMRAQTSFTKCWAIRLPPRRAAQDLAAALQARLQPTMQHMAIPVPVKQGCVGPKSHHDSKQRDGHRH